MGGVSDTFSAYEHECSPTERLNLKKKLEETNKNVK